MFSNLSMTRKNVLIFLKKKKKYGIQKRRNADLILRIFYDISNNFPPGKNILK